MMANASAASFSESHAAGSHPAGSRGMVLYEYSGRYYVSFSNIFCFSRNISLPLFFLLWRAPQALARWLKVYVIGYTAQNS